MNAGNSNGTIPMPENRSHLWSNQPSIVVMYSSFGRCWARIPSAMAYIVSANFGSSVSVTSRGMITSSPVVRVMLRVGFDHEAGHLPAAGGDVGEACGAQAGQAA